MGLRRGREREDGWSGGEWVARSGGFPTAVGLNGRLGKRPSVCWERGPAVRIPPEGGATNSEPSAGGERPLAGARGYGEALRWDVVHSLALAATGEALRRDVVHLLALAATGAALTMGCRPLAGARGYGGGAAMGCRPLAGARGCGGGAAMGCRPLAGARGYGGGGRKASTRSRSQPRIKLTGPFSRRAWPGRRRGRVRKVRRTSAGDS